LADTFVHEGLNFMDLAGNCHVRIGERYVAMIRGQRPPERAFVDKGLRAPALRVLLALRAEPQLVTATTRQLSAAAGHVSPQTAADVLKRLLAAGILLRSRGTIRWAPGGRKLALDWLVAGIPVLATSTLIGRFRAKTTNLRELEEELTGGLASLESPWRWGGGIACQHLTGFYRGDRTVVYIHRPNQESTRPLTRLPLIPDPNGPVALYNAPGPVAFQGPVDAVVHPLLVYLDLLGEGDDRSREAAAEIHHKFLGDDEQ
jgi:hypothetical protein